MKIVLLAFFSATLYGALAFNEDPRCTRRRELGTFPLGPDDHIIEDGASNAIVPARTVERSDGKPAKNLRGSTPRRLDGDGLVFQLRMHWEEGYCWQEEWEERRWCLECEGSSCGEDDHLWIKECDSDEEEQHFVYESVNAANNAIKLKPYTAQNLCWTRTGVNRHTLKPCGSDYLDGEGNDKQVLIGFRDQGTFELNPNGRDQPGDCSECPQCMEQHHHPKAEEIVRANDCESSRNDKTSLWVADIISGSVPSGGTSPTPSPSTTSTAAPTTSTPTPTTTPVTPTIPPGGPTLDFRGSEYCNAATGVLCGLCMGDCDSDLDCEGDLVCFQRNENQVVPGCSGGLDDNSKSDYCVNPS